METIVSHCAQMAAVYPGSLMLTHIASRRQTQSAELKVFLADLSRRVTDTTRRAGAPTLADFQARVAMAPAKP